jgi:two-component system CheB/CheR fusion protein
MPEALLNFVQHPQITNKSSKHNLLGTTDDTVAQILDAVKEYADVDFTHYKKNTVLRRIDRRMSINQLEKLTDYLRYLYQDSKEVKVLYKKLLIGVTKFFRDHEMFDAICDIVLPQFFEHKAPQDEIIIWVAGCSTGE